MKKYMVDARGKQCPSPVVETKKMLAQMAESDIVETGGQCHCRAESGENGKTKTAGMFLGTTG